MNQADFEEIKEYYAFSRQCWADPRPRTLTDREHELIKKYQGMDLLLVMIEAFEKSQLAEFAAKDRAWTFEKDKAALQLRVKTLERAERERDLARSQVAVRDARIDEVMLELAKARGLKP